MSHSVRKLIEDAGGTVMSEKRIQDLLDAADLSRAPETLRDLSVSMASYIAAIDSQSADVAAYIEQRLQPLVALMRTDVRVERAVEQMRDDGRQLLGRSDRSTP